MIDFLKKIFSSKDRELTFVLFDDREPESSNSYRFKPDKLLGLFYGSLALTAVTVLLLVMFTPLGSFLYNQQDEQIRQEVIEIQKKVAALKDSLNARDMQLAEIKEVLATGGDTTFNIEGELESAGSRQAGREVLEPRENFGVNREEMISENEIIFSSLFKGSPEFPTSYPVEGSLTRGYNSESGHFGIDIATKSNVPFRVIAEGVVINQDWTLNYGYVIHVQHNDGIISVYKHAESVTRSVGDIVLKGDIIGTVGDVGVLSSGPHLHLEIWKNGVPQNPNGYLIKS